MRPPGISKDAQMWYMCDGCAHEFEDAEAFANKTPPKCPKCGGKTTEVYPCPLYFRGRYSKDGLPIFE